MKNGLFQAFRQSGMSISEMIVAMGVFSVAMTALLTASTALQMSYAATENYFTNQGDQMRVMDYFDTDLRRAMAVSLNSNSVVYRGVAYSNTVPTGATKYLTVVIPNYRLQTTTPSTIQIPIVNQDVVSYGSGPVTVTYYLIGGSLYRLEVDPDLPPSDSRNNPASIADNISDFNITDAQVINPLVTQTVVSISATFAPKFSRSNWAAALLSNTSARLGTTVGTKIELRNVF